MQKTSAFLHSVAQDLKNKFEEDISEIAIVFNNSRPITYLRKHLLDAYGKPLWAPDFFTIQDFFKNSSSHEVVGQIPQFFYLYELHNNLLAEEGIEPESLEEFYPIAETILTDFSQLDYELVNVNDIYTALFDTSQIEMDFQYLTPEQQGFLKEFWQSFHPESQTYIQKRFLKLWRRLPKLYELFKNKLKEEKQTNISTIYRALAEGRADLPDFYKKYKKIVFVGFNALSKAEEILFKKWQEEGIALFYFDADAYYLNDNRQEAGLFIRKNKFKTGLQDAIRHTPDQISKRTKPIYTHACLGETSQAKLLGETIRTLSSDEISRSAILLADENLLVPLLQSLPDNVSKNINITAGFPLFQSPLYGLMDLWINVQEQLAFHKKEKLPYEWVDSFLNHPLTKVADTEKAKIQEHVYSRQLAEIEVDKIQVTTSLLSDFFTPVNESRDFIPRLLEILKKLILSPSEENQQKQIQVHLIVETQKTLNQLHEGLKNLPIGSLIFLIGLVRKTLSHVKAAIKGKPLEGMQVLGLLESRCLNFEHVFILGVNEGILPNTSPSITFLPNNLRRAYGLPILENQDALSAYLFYRQIQKDNNIHLYYNSIISQNSSGEESRFIRQLQFESKIPFVQHVHQQKIHAPEKREELIIEKKGEIWDKMYHSYLKGDKSISATALTTYLQSPLQFFLKNIAEIKEPPSLAQEFEMRTLGTVIHNVMEDVFLPYKGKENFTSTQELKKTKEKTHGFILHHINKEYNTQCKTIKELNSMQKIMYKIASEYVNIYLQYDIDHYKEFKIVELENDKDYRISFPIEVNGKEERVLLFGIIDRVDQVVTQDGEIQTRIVDYKTGSDELKVKDFFNMHDSSNRGNKPFVQTLFYSYIFEKCTPYKNLEPHLYVARKMRSDGTLFKRGKSVFSGEELPPIKKEFEEFLRETLEEIFNADIPFRHNPEAIPFDSDPYQLFYSENSADDEKDEE